MLSNIIGCVGCDAVSSGSRGDGMTSLLAGCFSRRMLCTVSLPLVTVNALSSGRRDPFKSEVRRRIADFTLPCIMKFANVCASLVLLAPVDVPRRCWMARPSRSRLSMSPSHHSCTFLSTHLTWSLAFETRKGFCSIRGEGIMAAV